MVLALFSGSFMANQKRILEPSCPFLFSLISSHTLSQICISLFFHDHFCHCIFCFPRAVCIACSIFNEYTRLGSGTWCIFAVFFALLSKKYLMYRTRRSYICPQVVFLRFVRHLLVCLHQHWLLWDIVSILGWQYERQICYILTSFMLLFIIISWII